MRVVAILGCSMLVAGCWSGRCEGGLRGVSDLGTRGEIHVNLDTGLHTGDEVMAFAHFNPNAVLLLGPGGPVPVTLEARVNPSAHSCASAGTLFVTASSPPLVPGDYTFVVFLDQVTWRTVGDAETSTWDGHPALVRQYHID